MDDPHSRAEAFWAENLDPQNLERAEEPRTLDIETEIAFCQAPDIDSALEWLNTANTSGSDFVVDLGSGLGAISFYMARQGHNVIAVDTSEERLTTLMARAKAAGVAQKITPLCGAAQALPFRDASVPRLFTKSVLIHTDIEACATELNRALSDGGRAALDEPQPANPFAWLYRNTLAPKEWKTITRYFDATAQRTFCDTVSGSNSHVRPFYLFGFGAFVFQFAWPNLTLFRLALKLSDLLDRTLFTIIPPLRKLAWFGLICLEKENSS